MHEKLDDGFNIKIKMVRTKPRIGVWHTQVEPSLKNKVKKTIKHNKRDIYEMSRYYD